MNRLSIRKKLLLLAGVPVLGALILSALIALGARSQAHAAAALGSVEDVARLSQRISAAIHALQTESARAASSEGTNARPDVTPADRKAASQAFLDSYAATDTAQASLLTFIKRYDTSKLPPRLARDMKVAETRLSELDPFRRRIANNDVPIEDVLAYYGGTDDALIRATGALTQLSDDGELLRPIWSLVAMAELTERGAREHALLSYVFSSTQFPPGSFKTFVTLMTEEHVYEDAFVSTGADAEVRRFKTGQDADGAKAVLAMRNRAVQTTDEVLHFDANEWFTDGEERLQGLHEVEDDIVANISAAATAKVAATRSSIRTSSALSLFVILSSALMAWAIARGLTRAVGNLSRVAEMVRTTKDYGVRASKTTGDELGMLTDAFNEMLADIQTRDTQLKHHRDNLETMVSARTSELVARNSAMRLVLNNVDQGLTTIHADGGLDGERSVAFDRYFGTPVENSPFAAALATFDSDLRIRLEMAWEQLVGGAIPLEMAIDQFPLLMTRDGRQFTLNIKPILDGTKVQGALLITTDVTAESLAREEQDRQREYIAVFERVMADKDGFVEFAEETGRILERLVHGANDAGELMRLVHTIKGNAAQWGVSSVARIAHQLESEAVSHEEPMTSAQIRILRDAWDAVATRFHPFLGGAAGRISVTRDEMKTLLSDIGARLPHEEILRRVRGLMHETTRVRFERMGSELERLAGRVGKPVPTVVIDDNDLRLPASRFASFWQSTVHLLRNLMDHGIESEDERVANGKNRHGTVSLRSETTPDRFRIEIEDDGRGINWVKLAAKAESAGLPSKTQADLDRALFSTGMSTSDEISDLSGRGVGLSSVEECCLALGGELRVESTEGAGTRFIAEFPRRGNEDSILPPASCRTASRGGATARLPHAGIG
jgi:two-component system, chemotaxis family, sensor kinase CheA